jgi:prepilin-type N-terminal cleavage/methylation domain-containing protein
MVLFRISAKASTSMVSRRHGFSLIELVVVIGIVGVLLALLMPAVQRVRDAGARAHCLNNLHQIAIGAQSYHDATGSFPAGIRLQAGKDPYLYSSWLTWLLPYLEQEPLWTQTKAAYTQSQSPFRNPPHVGLSTPIKLFGCPSDPRANEVQFAPVDQFFVATTSYLGVEGKDLTTLDGVFYRDSHTRIGDIKDGTSQTVMVGERPPSANSQFGWWYAGVGQRFTGSCDVVLGVEEQNVQPVTVGSCAPGTYRFGPGRLSNQCDMFHFWSPHTGGGAHFLFADSSAHFLPYTAAPLLPALASKAAGDVVPNGDW